MRVTNGIEVIFATRLIPARSVLTVNPCRSIGRIKMKGIGLGAAATGSDKEPGQKQKRPQVLPARVLIGPSPSSSGGSSQERC